jgi:hypothetical protein
MIENIHSLEQIVMDRQHDILREMTELRRAERTRRAAKSGAQSRVARARPSLTAALRVALGGALVAWGRRLQGTGLPGPDGAQIFSNTSL